MKYHKIQQLGNEPHYKSISYLRMMGLRPSGKRRESKSTVFEEIGQLNGSASDIETESALDGAGGAVPAGQSG